MIGLRGSPAIAENARATGENPPNLIFYSQSTSRQQLASNFVTPPTGPNAFFMFTQALTGFSPVSSLTTNALKRPGFLAVLAG